MSHPPRFNLSALEVARIYSIGYYAVDGGDDHQHIAVRSAFLAGLTDKAANQARSNKGGWDFEDAYNDGYDYSPNPETP